MRAFLLNGPGDAGVQTVPDPVPGPDELLVRPDVSGLCGTDVHMYRDGTLTRPEALPVVMGHEFTGVVEEIGPSALERRPYPEDRPLRVGDRVAVEPMLPCGRCLQCLRGRPNLCVDWSHLGILADGAWADFVAVPGFRAVRIDGRVEPMAAGLLEPLACALNFVVDRGQLTPAESVLVLGAGPIGLLCAQVAAATGAAHVVVSEPHPARRQLALDTGATAVVDPSSYPADLRELTDGQDIDLVVEASGATEAVAATIELAPSGARVVLAGFTASDLVPINVNVLIQKQLDLRGGFASRWAFQRALHLLAQNRVQVAALISSRRSWTEALDAMAVTASDPTTCKILFEHC